MENSTPAWDALVLDAQSWSKNERREQLAGMLTALLCKYPASQASEPSNERTRQRKHATRELRGELQGFFLQATPSLAPFLYTSNGPAVLALPGQRWWGTNKDSVDAAADRVCLWVEETVASVLALHTSVQACLSSDEVVAARGFEDGVHRIVLGMSMRHGFEEGWSGEVFCWVELLFEALGCSRTEGQANELSSVVERYCVDWEQPSKERLREFTEALRALLVAQGVVQRRATTMVSPPAFQGPWAKSP